MFLHRFFALLSSICFALSGCGPKKSSESVSTNSTQVAPGSYPTEQKPPQQPPSRLFVRESFQTKSELGLHDFPRGAEVTLLEIDGDDYVVERDGVSVKISKEFFSETPPEPAPTPNSEPTQNIQTINPPPPSTQLTHSPNQQATPGTEKNSDAFPNDTATDFPSSIPPDPATTPYTVPPSTSPSPPPLTEEQKKIERLTESLRTINEQIRTLRQSLNESNASSDHHELNALEKKREQLGAELSELAKP